MNRFLPSAAIVSMIFLHGAAPGQEIKGVALVQAQDPKRGSIPDMVYGYGIAAPSSGSTLTASFQRDGRVSDIMVQVGDQFKMGDTLLDFGASPAAVVASGTRLAAFKWPAGVNVANWYDQSTLVVE